MEARCPRQPLVDRHFQGRITPAEESELRVHLPTCPACERRYQRQGLLAELTRARPARAERLAVGLGLRPSRAPRVVLVALPALAAAACLALVGMRLLHPSADEFTSRGHAPAATTAELEVFRVPRGGAPVRAQGWVAAGDELAFAYRNPGGFRYLMVFGRDERGEIHWFHPAWTEPAQDPVAVPAAPGVGPHELGEAVRHQLPGRRLVVTGLFSNEPLSVREVERRVRAGRLGGPQLVRVDVPLELR